MKTTNMKAKDFLNYRVVCEGCSKTLFFSGQDNGETIKVLCDKCTEAMIAADLKPGRMP
ncbi:hypothetical protein Desor_1507 [Desulfosporosinus orientis DSM 765]|uniref:Uncharacterized protein n=1 Tax=Desulfosporosinus orientis (strain ATCC 19365 / DSM 765 / NCIMB 8382 / VKM B-1628 / Singapore I) TaxID=768706 RepID=G7WAV1_DESOD|nr:hypothetical protein [Desulfosporosinus orientis]AET67162.1 hypothetical protein Desor_1507 [Desulfosporosinus orientis DSM 765]